VLVLGLDTSSPAVTVALIESDDAPPVPPPGLKAGESFVTSRPAPTAIAAQTEVAVNRHGELLAPMIASVMTAAGVAADALDAIAVGLGPGPFTGLRVGIMTAKAMGDALDIPVYGECSLDVIARELGYAAYDDDNDEEHGYVVMSDARRKQVYWATYDPYGHRVDGPEIGRPADVAEELRGRIAHVAGAGALLYRDTFHDFTVIERSPYPSAATLAEMAWMRRREPADVLAPMYLRRPDAQPPGAPKRVTPV
jgi:tRNA threonylcarbamoyl adenosine modification protein YeaZ